VLRKYSIAISTIPIFALGSALSAIDLAMNSSACPTEFPHYTFSPPLRKDAHVYLAFKLSVTLYFVQGYLSSKISWIFKFSWMWRHVNCWEVSYAQDDCLSLQTKTEWCFETSGTTGPSTKVYSVD
jgi:hypothetical protein